MATVELDIKPWGNNLGVRLPAAIAHAAGLRANQRVRIAVEDGRVVVTPMAAAPLTLEPLTLEQRLVRFDPRRHGGEAMVVGERLGAEQW